MFYEIAHSDGNVKNTSNHVTINNNKMTQIACILQI